MALLKFLFSLQSAFQKWFHFIFRLFINFLLSFNEKSEEVNWICMTSAVLENRKKFPIPSIDKNIQTFIFDIDYCLFESPKMQEAEQEFLKKYRSELEEKYEDINWNEGIAKFGSRKLHLHFGLNISFQEISEKYEFMDFESFLSKDEELISMIRKLKGKKACLTNGSQKKAKKLLTCLGLEKEFEFVFCAGDTNHLENLKLENGENFKNHPENYSKPNEKCFLFVQEYLNITGNTHEIFYFDDNIKNINAASKLGWKGRHVSACALEISPNKKRVNLKEILYQEFLNE